MICNYGNGLLKSGIQNNRSFFITISRMGKIFLSHKYYITLGFFCAILLLNIDYTSHDIWWHLQIGKDISAKYLYPEYDTYSYTAYGSYMCLHSWASDVLFYGLYSCFGMDFLTLFKILIHTLFVYLIMVGVWKETQNEFITILSMLISAFLIHHREVRPYIFNPIFLLFSYNLFIKFRQFLNTKYMMTLIILYIVWTNLHGMSPIVVLFMLTSLFIEIIICLFSNSPTSYLRQLTNILIWTVVLFLASFIHPTPLNLVIRIFNSPKYPTVDWHNIFLFADSGNPFTSMLFFIYGLVFIIFTYSLYLYFLSSLRKDYAHVINFEIIFSFICLLLSCFINRLSYFLIIPFITSLKIIIVHANPILKIFDKYLHYFFFLFIVLTILFTQCRYSHDQWCSKEPIGAIAFCERQNIRGNIFTHVLWGGYVTFHTNGKMKIHSDTRLEPFLRKGLIKENLSTFWYVGDKIDYLRMYDTTHLLLPRIHPQIKELMRHPSLKIVFQNNNEVLLELLSPL